MSAWDLLFTGGLVLPSVGQEPFIGFVAVTGDRIVAVGAGDPPAEAPEARRTIDARGLLLMPGLVNCHNHAAMTLFRGMADDLPLEVWLHEHIFPAEARAVHPEMVYWCSLLAAAEMLLGGTTTVADSYFFEDEACRAFIDSGIRAVAAQGVIDFPAPGAPDPSKAVAQAAAFIDRWRNRHPRLTPAVFCHSPYTCSDGTLVQAKNMAAERGALFFIHLAETVGEVEQCQREHGCSPTAWLHRLGVLDRHTVCVHCVHVDAGDIDLLAAHDAAVVSCPESNMKLASGIAPLPQLAERCRVGLGTDSAASNNDLDLFAEMGSCARLHKALAGDPTVVPASLALRLATEGGAAVLGMEEKVGRLAKGHKADITVVNLDQPRLTPFYSPDILVYAAGGGDVAFVVVDGEIVVEDGRIVTIDLEEVMARVRELARPKNRRNGTS